MEIRVYGLGYIGMVTALGLTRDNLSVHGVEKVKSKVDTLKKGKLHVYEPGLDTWLKDALAKNLFDCSAKSEFAGNEKELVALFCVGTPMGALGEVDLSQTESALKDFMDGLKNSSHRNILVVLRSTVPPGTSNSIFVKAIEKFNKDHTDKRIDFLYYPEFLRASSALQDFANPKLIVLGSDKPGSQLEERWSSFLKLIPGYARGKWVDIKTAEIIKYAQNSFNALRISFSNELATLSSFYGVDSRQVYELMAENISHEKSGDYLRPGFSFGGPCLVKEVEALAWLGKRSGHELPVISNISKSNEEHFKRFLATIQRTGAKKVLILGISFKPETDDLRSSFSLKLVEKLLDGPSYKEKVQVTIVERSEVVEKATKYWQYNEKVEVITLDKLKSENHELVVFGPLRIDTKVRKSLTENSEKVIHLGFFEELPDFNF